jgi:hypothetical protein
MNDGAHKQHCRPYVKGFLLGSSLENLPNAPYVSVTVTFQRGREFELSGRDQVGTEDARWSGQSERG